MDEGVPTNGRLAFTYTTTGKGCNADLALRMELCKRVLCGTGTGLQYEQCASLPSPNIRKQQLTPVLLCPALPWYV